MIQRRNIIAVASNWHFDPTSKHHVMTILSRENNVLWINYHGSRRPQVCAADAGAMWRKLRQFACGTEQVSESMRVLTPLLLPLPGSPWARQINQFVVVRQIRRALAQFRAQPVQLWSFAPDAGYLVGQFGEELDLYYCVDEFSEFSGYDTVRTQQLERELIESCDIVLTTAKHLQASKSPLHPHTHLVTHGVSYEHFANATSESTEIPSNIRSMSSPIFGFFGAIQDWVDLELVCQLAQRHREWSFVLLGKQETSVDACRSHPNIHLLGQVAFDTLPGYCRAFDVGLIPFKLNPLTVNVNPIKLREYLAAGLPVVSSDLPEVRQYVPHVLIGHDLDAFDRACRQALQQRTEEHRRERQQAVQHETWEHKVDYICTLVTQILEQDGAVMHDPANEQPASPGISAVDSTHSR